MPTARSGLALVAHLVGTSSFSLLPARGPRPTAGVPPAGPEAYGVGSLNLAVPPKHRTLAVTIAPPTDKLAPGAKTSLAVTVKDAAGNIAAAQAELDGLMAQA